MAGRDSEASLKTAAASIHFCHYPRSVVNLSVNAVYVILHSRAMMMHMQTRAMRGTKGTTARAKGKSPVLLRALCMMFFSFKGVETLVSEFEL